MAPNLYELVDLENEILSYPKLYEGVVNYLGQFDKIDKLIGLSLGGILALNYIVEHPGKINELIISGGQYKVPAHLMKLQIAMFRIFPKSLIEKSGISKDDAIRLMQSSLDLDLTDQLTQYSGKAKILIGNKDKANRKAAEQMAKLLSNAKLYVVEGNHELNVEAADEFAAIIEE